MAAAVASAELTPAPLDVLIVDDSAVARAALRRIVEDRPELRVREVCDRATRAAAWLADHAVDVILLDLQMPGTHGLDALPSLIAAARGAPILIVSSLATAGAQATLRALALGAADTLAKPQAGQFNAAFADALADRIVKLGRTRQMADGPRELLPLRAGGAAPPHAVVIGASTGGIQALEALIGALPMRFALPILITQHLPASFVAFFADHLATRTGRKVEVAADGQPVTARTVLVAPGTAHLGLERRRGRVHVRLHTERAETRCLPSVDPMFATAAQIWNEHLRAVVLTGMGRDGFEGARQVIANGGDVLVQDQQSATVWGMPGVIARAGLACRIDRPEALGQALAQAV